MPPLDTDPDGLSRRRWLQRMGASLALAGAGGCRWEKAEIVPFVSQPANRVPGQTLRFATAMDLGGSALGLLVTSVDGRPIKIEGNPKHPVSLGATDLVAQAAILELYDPDRSQMIYEHTARTWEEFASFARPHFAGLKQSGGAGLRLLAEASSSPTLAGLRSELLTAFPQAKWHEYEPLSRDNEREGTRLCFGRPHRVHLDLEKARVILCLDADPLGDHPEAVRHARQFARGREVVEGRMSRLYAVESCLSITGGVADHRLALQSSLIGSFVEALGRAIRGGPGGLAAPAGEKTPGVTSFLRAAAEDLWQHRGKCLVVAGPRQPPEVHARVQEINALLGNFGKTLRYTEDPEPDRPPHVEALKSLVEEIGRGEVKTLVLLGGNPVYDAPADLDFARAFESVPTRIHLGLYRNETARLATWHVPQAHFLESWGDARAYDGTYSIVQPLVDPLCGGRSSIELAAFLLGREKPGGYALVRETFQRIVEKDWEAKWKVALCDGLLADSARKAVAPELARSFFGDAKDTSAKGTVPFSLRENWDSPLRENRDSPQVVETAGELEIVFCRGAAVYDGRFANNGWLQELPDPATKLTWDNAALLSPATARRLGVDTGSLVRLRLPGRGPLEMPVYVMPGQAAGSVAVALGYGRTAAGKVGGSAADDVPPVGVNVYPLRTSRAMHFETALAVEPAGRHYPLAATQELYAIDAVGFRARAERIGPLVREATLDEYRKNPKFAQHVIHHPPLESLWKEPEYPGHRWGMTIDLSKCTGCSACVVACQAENNVPVVGKERVIRGRQMHWIRVDRYFRGDADDPRAVFQVVTCHHCENAPCEQVCPVAATLHSQEGLNEMVYNRCVGTRYCANNCPYKVRRFNFFNYHKDLEDPANEVRKMVYNPEVTVRSRGVMEKCTYCVQRIQAAKIEAKNHRRPVRDGEIRTACQQACPAGAILFGDLADPQSAISRQLAADPSSRDRAYQMLAELNVKPRTSYLARVRNPNPILTLQDDAAHEHDGAAGI